MIGRPPEWNIDDAYVLDGGVRRSLILKIVIYILSIIHLQFQRA